MKSFSSEAKVGLFTLSILGILVYASFQLGGYSLRQYNGYEVELKMSRIQGIDEGTTIFYSGVEIGKIEKVGLDPKGGAILKAKIYKGVKLPKGTVAKISMPGILGEPFIELVPPEDEEELAPLETVTMLERGAIIEEGPEPSDMNRIMTKVESIADDIKAVTSVLKETLGSTKGQQSLEEILENIRLITATVRDTTDNADERIIRIIKNLEELSRALSTQGPVILHNLTVLSESLKLAMDGKGSQFGDSMNNINSATEKLDKTLEHIESITKKIDEGKGTVGKLINDEETVDRLNETLSGLNDMLGAANTIRLLFKYRAEVQFNKGDVKTFTSLKIQPKPDKYFLAELVTDSLGGVPKKVERKKTITQTDNPGQPGPNPRSNVITEEELEVDRKALKFSLEIAKRFRNLTIRGGMIESTGGLGFDYHLLDEDVMLTFEVFDFGANDFVGDTGPNLRFKTEYYIYNHILLAAGVDDMINTDMGPRYFVGGGFQFDDEDMKLIIMNAGGALF